MKKTKKDLEAENAELRREIERLNRALGLFADVVERLMTAPPTTTIVLPPIVPAPSVPAAPWVPYTAPVVPDWIYRPDAWPKITCASTLDIPNTMGTITVNAVQPRIQ